MKTHKLQYRLSGYLLDRHNLIRYINYRILVEEFLISSVTAILGIRLFLKFSGYPTIGGVDLHISHMLWGGLLLSVALMQCFVFINNSVKHSAAIIGGLGFGTFIDEMGKFITRDYNYFYKPTFAIIYLIFVLFFILLYLIERGRHYTDKEYLVNSIEIMKEAVINDLDEDEKERALVYLQSADGESLITRTLKSLYAGLDALPAQPQGLIQIWRAKTSFYYRLLVKKRWFRRTVILFFILQGLMSIVATTIFVFDRPAIGIGSVLFPIYDLNKASLNFVQVIATAISLVIIIYGILNIQRSRLDAYIHFKRSILISILLNQVFAFYYSPFRAFSTLVLDIFILTLINYMIDNELSLLKISA